MAKKKNDPMWAEVKKRCRLNALTVQMAKELGLNPKSLIKNIPSKGQPWKAPVHVWIRDMYGDRFGQEKLSQMTKGSTVSNKEQAAKRADEEDDWLDL